jgi:hypothetical protein
MTTAATRAATGIGVGSVRRTDGTMERRHPVGREGKRAQPEDQHEQLDGEYGPVIVQLRTGGAVRDEPVDEKDDARDAREDAEPSCLFGVLDGYLSAFSGGGVSHHM